MSKTSKNKPSTIMVCHGTITHPIGAECSFCKKVEKKFDKSIYSIKEGDPCPVCKHKERDGIMVKRHGKYGDFLGCSKFPQCSHVARIKSDIPSNWDLIKQADAILGKAYKLI